MALDWYPWFPLVFRGKTLHLTLEQDGAYRRLIDEYMIRRGPLPDNDAALARLLGVSVEHWKELAPFVRPFFDAHAGMLVHGRCEEEIEVQEKKGQRRTEISQHAANVRWGRANGFKALDAPGMHQAPHAHASSSAQAMLPDATLHYTKNITSSFPIAAREEPEVSPPTEPVEASEGLPTRKPVSALTRAELDAIIANRKPAAPKAAPPPIPYMPKGARV